MSAAAEGPDGQMAGRSHPPDAVLAALKRGDGPAAARLAEAALRQGEVHPLLYDLRARRALSQGQLPRALEDFQAAARLAPESADLQQAQGAVLVRLGRGREAIAAFARALELRPDLGGVWYDLGMAQIGEGDVAAARASLIQAVDRLPGHAEPLGQLSGRLGRGAAARPGGAVAGPRPSLGHPRPGGS